MASPLAPFVNARILWHAPGVRTSGREGFKVSKGQAYLIQAFLKQGGADNANRLDLPAIGGESRVFSGYVISYAPVDQVIADGFADADISGLTFDTSALLPSGVAHDSRAELYVDGFGEITARFAVITNAYGKDGIGQIITDVLGDRIVLDGGQP